MSQSTSTNRQVVLAERPHGEPTDSSFRIVESPIPEPGAGEMLLRTVYLSLDPYMRGRMSDEPSYAAPVQIGEVMVGGTVSRVVKSNLDRFKPGDWVVSYSGWQDYALSNGKGVLNLGPAPARPSWALGISGMPGFTAWAGLTQIGNPQPGETIVVAAATGPVGATVGQIGKILGCRVVGVAGGPEKCAFAVNELGFDACLDHKDPGFAEQLAAAVPNGIDVYYENVGGQVLDAVLPLLNANARVPVCGLVSQYNATRLPPGPDRLSLLMGHILKKKLRLQGFIIFDTFPHLYPEFAKAMEGWITQGKIKYREEILDGLEAAPRGLIGLLRGDNFGKRVIRVGKD
ncbi:MAG: NADP-dependent oxidoreductase [Planctomycetaceae bacterium]